MSCKIKKLMNSKFRELFNSVDNSDANSFLTFLSDDAIFTFGNMEPVYGKDNIREFLNQFFESIDHTIHSDIEAYNAGSVWFTTGNVTYKRKDGSELKVPFCNKFEMKDENTIKKYDIFVDNSALYQ